MSAQSTPPLCTTVEQLRANEGELVVVQGIYRFPKQKAFAVNEVELSDGARVVVVAPREGVFSPPNDGAPMQVTGRIYIGEIPERYQIIARRPDPYLVDVDPAAVVFGPSPPGP